MARQIAVDIARALEEGRCKSIKNTMTDGTAVYLHGHKIIERREDGGWWVTLAGWNTATTRRRIKDVLGQILPFNNVGISCRNFEPYLYGSKGAPNGPIDPDQWYQVA